MESTEKTVFIVGGLAIGAVLLFSFMKHTQQNRLVALNQPGLLGQPSMPANYDLANIISSTAGGVADFFNNVFSGSGSGDLNDPGLEYQDSTSYPGADYTYQNSNSYGSYYDSSSYD